ncbi:hypothetical protein DOTSEDRAFT_136711, partial [Dothistroma septosporum NZE10]
WARNCCIDKNGLAEYAESVNCMYRWYQKARVCHAQRSNEDQSTGFESASRR